MSVHRSASVANTYRLRFVSSMSSPSIAMTEAWYIGGKERRQHGLADGADTDQIRIADLDAWNPKVFAQGVLADGPVPGRQDEGTEVAAAAGVSPSDRLKTSPTPTHAAR